MERYAKDGRAASQRRCHRRCHRRWQGPRNGAWRDRGHGEARGARGVAHRRPSWVAPGRGRQEAREEADKKREKAQEKAFFLYFATARPEVERACKKAVLAWKAAERAAHAKDAPRAAQLAARASTLAKMALAKEAVVLALPTEFEQDVAKFKTYLAPFVARAGRAAVLAQRAAVRAAK